MSQEMATFFLVLLAIIAVLLLVIIPILYLDWHKDNLQPICSSKTGAAMWFYADAYARDMNSQEKRRWCPKWTPTPTATYQLPPTYGYPGDAP